MIDIPSHVIYDPIACYHRQTKLHRHVFIHYRSR